MNLTGQNYSLLSNLRLLTIQQLFYYHDHFLAYKLYYLYNYYLPSVPLANPHHLNFETRTWEYPKSQSYVYFGTQKLFYADDLQIYV